MMGRKGVGTHRRGSKEEGGSAAVDSTNDEVGGPRRSVLQLEKEGEHQQEKDEVIL